MCESNLPSSVSNVGYFFEPMDSSLRVFEWIYFLFCISNELHHFFFKNPGRDVIKIEFFLFPRDSFLTRFILFHRHCESSPSSTPDVGELLGGIGGVAFSPAKV